MDDRISTTERFKRRIMWVQRWCAQERPKRKGKKKGRKFCIWMLVRKVDGNSTSKGGSTPGYLQELGFTAPRLKLGSWCLGENAETNRGATGLITLLGNKTGKIPTNPPEQKGRERAFSTCWIRGVRDLVRFRWELWRQREPLGWEGRTGRWTVEVYWKKKRRTQRRG